MFPTYLLFCCTPYSSKKDTSQSPTWPTPPTCKNRLLYERHRLLFSFIKAKLSEERFELTSQDPLVILDPIMGPTGFVIHDIYQINCHRERWWPAAKTKPHIIVILLGKEVVQLCLQWKINIPSIDQSHVYEFYFVLSCFCKKGARDLPSMHFLTKNLINIKAWSISYVSTEFVIVLEGKYYVLWGFCRHRSSCDRVWIKDRHIVRNKVIKMSGNFCQQDVFCKRNQMLQRQCSCVCRCKHEGIPHIHEQ